MSTIVVVKKNGSIIIGADSLTKYGDAKEPAEFIKDYSKIVSCDESKFAFVGHSSFGLVLESHLSSQEEKSSLNSKAEIFEFSRKLHPELKKNYYLVASDDDTFECSDIDCLVANRSGIYGLYGMQNVQEYSKFYSFGSGSQYAMGVMHALYEQDFSAQQIATKALEAACCFDDASDSPFEVEEV